MKKVKILKLSVSDGEREAPAAIDPLAITAVVPLPFGAEPFGGCTVYTQNLTMRVSEAAADVIKAWEDALDPPPPTAEDYA